MNLFQLGDFTLASGQTSRYKIECDALVEADWECLAYLGSLKLPPFGEVIGVPFGGFPFARAMEKYRARAGPRLVVDDVFTTGGSLRKFMRPGDLGLVAFARSRPPGWLKVVCQL